MQRKVYRCIIVFLMLRLARGGGCLSVDRATNVIALEVFEGRHKPYFYKGKAYKRQETSTIEVDNTEVKRLILLGENRYLKS